MVAKVSFLGYAGPLLWEPMARQYIRKENCLLELRRGAGRDQSGPIQLKDTTSVIQCFSRPHLKLIPSAVTPITALAFGTRLRSQTQHLETKEIRLPCLKVACPSSAVGKSQGDSCSPY